MKQDCDLYEQVYESRIERKPSHLKKLSSKEISVQQKRKKRRVHTNLILKELKLIEKLNHDDFLKKQQNNLRNFENLRNSQLRGLKKSSKRFQLSFNHIEHPSSVRLSNFCESKSDLDNPRNKISVFDSKQKEKREYKCTSVLNSNRKFIQNQTSKNKNEKKQTKNIISSSLNDKIRQIDIISKTFDQVHSYYPLNYNNSQQNYRHKHSDSQTSNFLKEFQSKLTLRKNIITQRKNSLKKNSKREYCYKATHRRFQTEVQEKDKENGNLIIPSYRKQDQYQTIWLQDARKLKNYISGGYSDEKNEFSEILDIEDFRKLKRNFRTFDQIYTSIKEDKDNPIELVIRNNLNKPSVLQIVGFMQKLQQEQVFKTSKKLL